MHAAAQIEPFVFALIFALVSAQIRAKIRAKTKGKAALICGPFAPLFVFPSFNALFVWGNRDGCSDMCVRASKALGVVPP